MSVEPNNIVGCFATEVGERQAWPFLQFCDPSSAQEARLYIDTIFLGLRSAVGRTAGVEHSAPAAPAESGGQERRCRSGEPHDRLL